VLELADYLSTSADGAAVSHAAPCAGHLVLNRQQVGYTVHVQQRQQGARHGAGLFYLSGAGAACAVRTTQTRAHPLSQFGRSPHRALAQPVCPRPGSALAIMFLLHNEYVTLMAVCVPDSTSSDPAPQLLAHWMSVSSRSPTCISVTYLLHEG
jgi:hypothetical protein